MNVLLDESLGAGCTGTIRVPRRSQRDGSDRRGRYLEQQGELRVLPRPDVAREILLQPLTRHEVVRVATVVDDVGVLRRVVQTQIHVAIE